jgi:sugar phosphate permease
MISSVFFWPYALFQPFGGLLADIIDPKYLLIFSCFGSGLGSLICGLSQSFPLTVFARFITGLSCAPCYVPVARLLSRWYSSQFFPIMTGILIASGSAGGLLSQIPLRAFADVFGFKTVFFSITGVNCVLGILVGLLIRGDPSQYGYDSIHPPQTTKLSAKENFLSLLSNLKTVLTQRYVYCCGIFCFFCVSLVTNFSSFWGGPYLRDVFPDLSDASILTSMSASFICSALLLPYISNLLNTRKYMLIGATTINLCITITFIFAHTYFNFAGLFIFFFIFGFVVAGNVAVVAGFLKELYGPEVAATAMGLANMCTSLGIPVHQNIGSAILKNFEKVDGHYPADGYRYCLWLEGTICLCISYLGPNFCPNFKPKSPQV